MLTEPVLQRRFFFQQSPLSVCFLTKMQFNMLVFTQVYVSLGLTLWLRSLSVRNAFVLMPLGTLCYNYARKPWLASIALNTTIRGSCNRNNLRMTRVPKKHCDLNNHVQPVPVCMFKQSENRVCRFLRISQATLPFNGRTQLTPPALSL